IGLHPDGRLLAGIFLGLATLATLYGMANASRTRVKRSEEHTSELQSHRDLHSFPTRRSSDLIGLHPDGRLLAGIFLGLATLATLYGMANASRTRVKKITVKLPNRPQTRRGRVAAQVSDLHLGHVRNLGFIRRIVTMLTRLRPDAVFITGDLYDGVAVDLDTLSSPWGEITPPLGAYFI